jgi:hypothetical protein
MTSTFVRPRCVASCSIQARCDGDVAARVVLRHPQRQGAPAAAKFEDRLSVGKSGALAGCGQRRNLGAGEIGDALRPPGAAVLAVRAEYLPEECGRNLVVLLIRQMWDDCDLGRVH